MTDFKPIKIQVLVQAEKGGGGSGNFGHRGRPGHLGGSVAKGGSGGGGAGGSSPRTEFMKKHDITNDNGQLEAGIQEQFKAEVAGNGKTLDIPGYKAGAVSKHLEKMGYQQVSKVSAGGQKQEIIMVNPKDNTGIRYAVIATASAHGDPRTLVDFSKTKPKHEFGKPGGNPKPTKAQIAEMDKRLADITASIAAMNAKKAAT